MKTVKTILHILLEILIAVLVIAAIVIGLLTITEYKPEDREAAVVTDQGGKAPFSGDTVKLMTFNIGYAGLSDNADFFMDGGKQVRATDHDRVKQNMEEIAAFAESVGADFTMLQEVDERSYRTFRENEVKYFADTLGQNAAFAPNYKSLFVPFPLPPIGGVNSGLETLSTYTLEDAERVKLPCPFKWPVSTANLKRCLLVTRTPIEGSDRELVIVNLHLEAYDDGEGKIAQTKMLLSVLREEYEKGNYVIAGGDFNQTFPHALERYPMQDPDLWTPGTLEEDALDEGWVYAYDLETPTCRLLDAPLSENNQRYVIDGFILSPNLELVSVETQNLNFHASDHNPVVMTVKMK